MAQNDTMRAALLSISLLLWGCWGCGGSAHKTPDAPFAGRTGAGSLQQPITRCGPHDSYRYVASQFACADGSNPFSGDAKRAARARSGARQNPETGHLIDTYEVPCRSGTVTVYIDMYGCEKYASMIDKQSAALGELQSRFDRGSYPDLIGECARILGRGGPPDAFGWCGVAVPATLVLLGDERAALAMKHTCDPMPAHSDKSDARVNAVELAMIALARGSAKAGPELDVEVAKRVLLAFSRACEVDPRDVVRRLAAESA